MLVKELVELLLKEDQNLEVVLDYNGAGGKRIEGVQTVPMNKYVKKSNYRWYPSNGHRCQSQGVVIHSGTILFPVVNIEKLYPSV